MKLTTRGRFAVTAMADIAFSKDDRPVSLVSISTRQKISLSYLEQLFGKLRRARLVVSVRGPGGGYLLSRATDKISVADIIRAVDESLDATQCGGKVDCHENKPCLTHDLWVSLNEKMYEYLNSVYLSDLVDGRLFSKQAAKQSSQDLRPTSLERRIIWPA